jgi:hypothetical protein
MAALHSILRHHRISVPDREVPQFERGIVIGKAAAGFHHLAQQAAVSRLDRVGGVDHLADAGRGREERNDMKLPPIAG